MFKAILLETMMRTRDGGCCCLDGEKSERTTGANSFPAKNFKNKSLKRFSSLRKMRERVKSKSGWEGGWEGDLWTT
jgi:hypothetical protein